MNKILRNYLNNGGWWFRFDNDLKNKLAQYLYFFKLIKIDDNKNIKY